MNKTVNSEHVQNSPYHISNHQPDKINGDARFDAVGDSEHDGSWSIIVQNFQYNGHHE